MPKQVLFVGSSLLQDVVGRLLAEEPEIEIIGVAAAWEDAKILIEATHPDILLMDENHELSEAQLTPLLDTINHPLKVVYLTPDENRITIYERKQIRDASLSDLLKALTAPEA